MRQTQTVQQIRAEAAAKLRAAGIESAALDARVLLAHVLGLSQTALLLMDPDPVSDAQLEAFLPLISQRSTGIPVAYLLGYREFMGLRYETSPDVLVPRPDTETLVEWGIRWLAHNRDASVADIGTGTGAIAISLAFHTSLYWRGTMTATDVSEEALEIARRNADTLLPPAVRHRTDFRQGYLGAPLVQPVDLLLTNLPYLTPDQMAENPALEHEPSLALDGGADGLDLVRKVIDDLPRILTPNGGVGFELDPSQAGTVKDLLQKALPEHSVEIVHDLAGDDRHVVAHRMQL